MAGDGKTPPPRRSLGIPMEFHCDHHGLGVFIREEPHLFEFHEGCDVGACVGFIGAGIFPADVADLWGHLGLISNIIFLIDSQIGQQGDHMVMGFGPCLAEGGVIDL